VGKPLPPASQLKANGSTSSFISNLTDQDPLTPTTDGTYVLSVVRLADPSHADIVELNVTESNITFSVPPPPLHIPASASLLGSFYNLACLPGELWNSTSSDIIRSAINSITIFRAICDLPDLSKTDYENKEHPLLSAMLRTEHNFI
jgi:hypothetical protein